MDDPIVDVDSGAVGSCQGHGTLRAMAVGSCVVVVLFDPSARAAVMLHVMLPGKAPASPRGSETRYAEDSLIAGRRLLERAGGDLAAAQVCLVGGADILGDPAPAIGDMNAESLRGLLRPWPCRIVAEDVGGTLRRSVEFNVESGRLCRSLGDGPLELLWRHRGDGDAPAGS